jgi:hypothetical protein
MKLGYLISDRSYKLAAVICPTFFVHMGSLILFFISFVPEILCQQDLHDAVVFWNGVNGNWRSQNQYSFSWQENTDYLLRFLQQRENEYAKPFEINANNGLNTAELTTRLQSYLTNCSSSGQKPFIVFVPKLNIVEYLLTLLPNKSFYPFVLPFLPKEFSDPVFYSESVVYSDKHWSQVVTPVVMNELAVFGYKASGYAYSWGAEIGCEGLRYSNYSLSNLLVINGRTSVNKLNELENTGKVQNIKRITTASDAFGKDAFGKGDIHVLNVESPHWGSMIKNHTIILNDPSAKVTFEVGGNVLKTNLGTLINSYSQFTEIKSKETLKDNRKRREDDIPPFNNQPPPPPPPPDQPVPVYTGGIKTSSRKNSGEKGVSMQMNIDSKEIKHDTTGILNELKKNLLEGRPQSDSLSWPVKMENQK